MFDYKFNNFMREASMAGLVSGMWITVLSYLWPTNYSLTGDTQLKIVFKRKEDEWKRKEGEWQAQQNSQKNQMKKLQDQLAKESKEKKEANGKLAAILKVINPQDSEVKIENREYIEPSDASEDPKTEYGASEDSSTGVKREAEALEQKGGAEKRPRHT